jgi:hypothetical protein
MPARQLRSRNQVPAVDYFYSAAALRSRCALWPIFAPALILDEMQAETTSKITKLDIRGDKPAVHFVFNETRRELGPQGPYNVSVNELRTEEISDTADVSFWRIREFLEERQRPRVRKLRLWAGIVSFLVSIFVLLRFGTIPGTDYITKVGLLTILFLCLSLASIITAPNVPSVMTLSKRGETKSFWARNREDLAKHAITASISGVIGAILGWIFKSILK